MRSILLLAALAAATTGCLTIGLGNPGGPGADPNQPPVDTDQDGINDRDEIDLGTDPSNADSDGDGLPDGLELSGGTNPLNPDSDGDGLDDGDEVDAGTDPRSANFAGSVSEVPCDAIVSVEPGSTAARVFFASGSPNFSGWEPGQQAIYEGERLINLARSGSTPAEPLGEFDRRAAFFDFAIGTSVIQLDDGSAWAIDSDDLFEAQDWRANDAIIVASPLGSGDPRLVNTTRCEVIRATPL